MMTLKIHSPSQFSRELPRATSGNSGQPGSKEEGSESDLALDEVEPRVKEPSSYAVLLLNDDYTTMDFVIEVLRRFFHRSGEEAARIMLHVHEQGQGVAGIYSYEIAETKAHQVHEYARSSGFPLKCVIKEAE